MIKRGLRKGLLEHVSQTGFMAYHGSPDRIENFVDDFVGSENATDQEGPGIYFTTSYDDAAMYGDYVYTVRLKGNFLVSTNDPYDMDRNFITQLTKMGEDWEMHAQNYHMDPDLGLEVFVDNAYDNNDDEKGVLQQVWIEFYRYDPISFVRNCTKLGIDGIVVDRYNNSENPGNHIIIYNPRCIQFVELNKT